MLLAATAGMAQSGAASTKTQLKQMQDKVQQQQAQAKDLQQQIDDLKQRNAAEQDALDKRDQEIARLKAQLAKQGAPAPAASSK
ncbi:hypothetical protein LF63_0110510 [Oleiagrimonas soli]|nr:hypothetical protein LF63_0110510 [Oleiagrimonas soli]